MSKESIKLMYVDLFCGAGGTSTGVEKAMWHGQKCARVVACVNHDPMAIASHAANHPDAVHYTEDIRTLELGPLVQHLNQSRMKYPNALVVLWASLECTNFSRAKGGLPRNADSRTLAEHLFRYIEAIKPDYIQIENVEEFMSWGDLDDNGKPVSKEKGRCYLRWVRQVKSYGYDFQHRILNAADFGAYTSRKRFFGIFAKKPLPIVWPEQTHCKETGNLLFQYEKWKPVKEVLDLNDEVKSIFDWKKPLVDASLKRIYAGLIKFVAGGEKGFLVKYNSMNQNGKYVAPGIDEPCPVVATQNRLGLAQVNFLSKAYSGDETSKNISIEQPAGTITTKDHHCFITVYYKNGFVRSVDEPAPTLTTADRCSLVDAQFLDLQYGNGTPSSIENPSPTVLANPKQKLITCRYLLNPQFDNAGNSVDKPCFTLIARMDKKPPYLVNATTTGVLPSFIRVDEDSISYEVEDGDTEIMIKIKEFMAMYGIINIKMRMLKITELKRIMGFPTDYILVGTQSEQKKFIGNAVEVNMAKALVESLSKCV